MHIYMRRTESISIHVYVYRCIIIYPQISGHCNVESFTYESVTNVTYELASPDLQSRHYSR